MKAKVGENEKAILKGENYEPVCYEWALRVLGGKFRDPDVAPIVRTAKKLGETERVIYRELEPWGAKSRRRLGSVMKEKDGP